MGFGLPAMQAVNPYAAQVVAPGVGAQGAGLQSMPLGAAAQAVGGGVADNVCIKMRGLPFSASVLDILGFFQGYNVVDNGVHIVVGPGERPTGEAYVEFATPEDAQRAMEKHRQHMGSRYVELFRVTKRSAGGPASRPVRVLCVAPGQGTPPLTVEESGFRALTLGFRIA